MVTKAMEKNKVKRIQRSMQGGMVSYCQDDKVTYDKVSHANIWGNSIQGRAKASTKVLR